MKRMHELLKPGLFNWQERHTGTGALTQDGTVISSNDDDLIHATQSVVYQLDHFDANSVKYIFKLVNNQFTFPSVSAESLKANGVRYDVDDESIWIQNVTVEYLRPFVTNGGLYAWPVKGTNGYEYKLIVELGGSSGDDVYTDSGINIFDWIREMKDYFISKGCKLTDDGYYAIIPGEYIEIVSHNAQQSVAKITILPKEIAIAPNHPRIYRLITTED